MCFDARRSLSQDSISRSSPRGGCGPCGAAAGGWGGRSGPGAGAFPGLGWAEKRVVGALLAVPTVAFFNNAFQVLLAEDPSAAAEKTDDDAVIMQAEPDGLEPERGTAD